MYDLRSLRQGQTGRPEAEKMFRAGISNPLLKVATRTVARQQTRSLTIPINQVSSAMECNVKNEETAEKADLITKKLAAKYKELHADGYVGYTRMVCKAKWDYKAIHVFSNLDHFVGKHVKDETSQREFNDAVGELKELIGGDVHTQNYVFDFEKIQVP